MASKTKLLLNVEKIRQDFPILSRTTRGKPLVYVSDFFSRYNANVHRAIYELGEEATREYEGAREKVAQFIHARTPNEVAFTKSTTESLNTIAYGWGMKGKMREGDEIVSTVMEHHSNHVPWFFVQDAKGVKMKWVGMTDDGALRMDEYDDLITKRTKVVTVTQCSNVLGTINPVQEIAKRAHEVGAICVVDGAQSVPHMAVDVQKIDCDFLAFSGHKMLGPTGIGVLYGKEERLQEMEHLMGGGEMIREVHL
ncbi:MAG: aminotransferase class V-fold PLP-dependent enzyme, partial [Methanobacteriota archaeon]